LGCNWAQEISIDDAKNNLLMLIHSVLENFREGAKDVIFMPDFQWRCTELSHHFHSILRKKVPSALLGGLQFALKPHKTR
jgi:hypothetical protein